MERIARLPILIVTALIAVWGAHALADATIPTKDIAGAKDNPLLKRYEGSLIVGYERLAYTDFRVPLSPLVEQTGKSDSANNVLFPPKQEKQVEGARTRIAYLVPGGRSPLEVLRNYEEEIKARGEIVFTCKGEDYGGDATRQVRAAAAAQV